MFHAPVSSSIYIRPAQCVSVFTVGRLVADDIGDAVLNVNKEQNFSSFHGAAPGGSPAVVKRSIKQSFMKTALMAHANYSLMEIIIHD